MNDQLPPLSPRQQDVLDAIKEFISKHGHMPSNLELADIMGIRTYAVLCHLRAMRKKGYLQWQPNLARTLVLTEPATVCPCCNQEINK